MKGAILALVLLTLGAGLGSVPVTAGQSASARSPAALQLSMAPPQLPADGHSYPAMAVSLLDANSQPTLSLTDVLVYLSTTNGTIASIPENVTISAGHTFAVVSVQTSANAGTVTLSATSQGLISAAVTVTTVRSSGVPATLNLYLHLRNTVQALQGADDGFVVLLRNSAGQPAVAKSDTSVVITSSNSTMIPWTIAATVRAGSSMVYGPLDPVAPGTTTMTALSSGLGTGDATLTMTGLAKSIMVTVTPSTLTNGQNASVQVSETVLGMPVQGADVALITSLGALIPAFGSTNAAGEFDSVYVSGGQGVATLNATSYSQVVGTLSTTYVQIVGQPSTSTAQSSSSFIPGLSTVMAYLPLIVVAVVAVVGLVVVRSTLRKRRGVQEEEYESPDAKS